MKYSISEIVYLSICKVVSFFLVPHSKIIRLPIDLRNRKAMSFGINFTTGKYCRIETNRNNRTIKSLRIGNNVQINDFVHISAWEQVVIGNDVLIASKVYISDVSHGNMKEQNYDITIAPIKQKLYCKPVHIGDKVWVGESVCILPGVTIGECSIIGAGSVVTKSIPPYSIAVGTPAKVIKRYNFDTRSWIKVDLDKM